MADQIFDYDGARKDGASDDDIIKYLDPKGEFDVAGALKDGSTKADIARYLASAPIPPPQPRTINPFKARAWANKKSFKPMSPGMEVDPQYADNPYTRKAEREAAPPAPPPAEHLPPPPVGFLKSAWQNMDPTVMWRAGQDAAAAIGGDTDAEDRFLDIGRGLYNNTKDELGKAYDSASQGGSEGIENAIRHGVRALPGIGNPAMDAAENFERGNYADAAGGVTGLIGGMLTGGALTKGIGKAVSKIPTEQLLREPAVRQYARAMGPTTKGNKVKAEEFIRGTPANPMAPAQIPVPGALDRGIWAWSLKSLYNKLDAAVTDLGQRIEEKHDTIPPGALLLRRKEVIANIVDNLQSRFLIEDPVTGKRIPASPGSDHGLAFGRDLMRRIKAASFQDPITKEWKIDFQALRKFRQAWDRDLNEKGAFQKDFLVGAESAAYRESSNAIRNQLNSNRPDIAALNAEFHHAILGRDVVGDTVIRKQSQSVPMSQQMVSAAGTGAGIARTGKLSYGLAVGAVLSNLRKLVSSTGYNTLSAVQKNNLADIMATGSPVMANFTITTYLQMLDEERKRRNSAQPLAPPRSLPPPPVGPAQAPPRQ